MSEEMRSAVEIAEELFEMVEERDNTIAELRKKVYRIEGVYLILISLSFIVIFILGMIAGGSL